MTKAYAVKLISPFVRQYYRKQIRRNWDLFDSISEVTGKEFIIDSSKNFLRFQLLHDFRPEDTFLVVLIRNVQGVSTSKHYENDDREILSKARNWSRLYRQVAGLIQRQPNIRVRWVDYGDLCQNPNETVNIIADFTGASELDTDVDGEIDTKKRHTVNGNPIRHMGQLRIKYDEKWKERTPEHLRHALDEMNHETYELFKAHLMPSKVSGAKLKNSEGVLK